MYGIYRIPSYMILHIFYITKILYQKVIIFYENRSLIMTLVLSLRWQLTIAFLVIFVIYISIHPAVHKLMYSANYGRSSETKLSEPVKVEGYAHHWSVEYSHRSNTRMKAKTVLFIGNATTLEAIIKELDPSEDASKISLRLNQSSTKVLREFNSSHIYFQPSSSYRAHIVPVQGIEKYWTSADSWDSITDRKKDIALILRVVKDKQTKKTLDSLSLNQPISYEKKFFSYFQKTEDVAEKATRNAHAFSFSDISEAKATTKKLLSLIYNRYEMGTSDGAQYFLLANNIPASTWDVMKYKLAKKIVSSALLGRQEDYIMVFAGSSLTAGIGNYFNESYPMIALKRLMPIFSALGITLRLLNDHLFHTTCIYNIHISIFRVRNIAQEDNNCNPYHVCFQSMGGLDPDWIGSEENSRCGGNENGAQFTSDHHIIFIIFKI